MRICGGPMWWAILRWSPTVVIAIQPAGRFLKSPERVADCVTGALRVRAHCMATS